MEVEAQAMILTNGLLKWEQGYDAAGHLKELMRAAHSLKGAARIVGRKVAVRIYAHAMEDCFVAAQKQKNTPSEALTNTLLAGIDLINRIAQVSDEALEDWEAGRQAEIETFVTSISSLASALGDSQAPTIPASPDSRQPIAAEPPHQTLEPTDDLRKLALHPDRVLRVTTENLDRLMGLAGEALVTSRWLDVFAANMLRHMKRGFNFSLAKVWRRCAISFRQRLWMNGSWDD